MPATLPESARRESALDLPLLRKYAVAAPRYTSYPPATRFTADFGPAEAAAAIAEDNRPGAGPLSLYLHVPFCASQCWYCGCTTVITRRSEAGTEYVADLEREIALTAHGMLSGRPVVQVHFGGGTPTWLAPADLSRLGAILYDNFSIEPDAEFGVEMDPRRLTRAHVQALAGMGANRASIGIQDTDPQVQLAIHRWQPPELNRKACAWLRDEGFRSINVDLIYGLPCQTAESFARTIEEVLALNPDRLSVFSYAHVPWVKPAQKAFERRGQLPDPEQKLAMYEVAHRLLAAAGYVDIGLDHFARPDDELALAQRARTLQRNFQGYSTRAGASLYGFGISSISSTPGTYRQNHKDLKTWQAAVRAGRLPVERGYRLTEDDRLRRVLIMRLMCDRRLDFAALGDELGVDVRALYPAEFEGLAALEADGLLERSAEGVVMTAAGVPLLRVAALQFDPLCAGSGRHSQTI